MKIMAGYDTRQKTDYRAKAAEEVGKVQQKARLLEERLESFKAGDVMTEGDVYEELASALQSAHPKIQRMCEEESDDHEAVAKLLEINDSIHRTVERYKLMKKGDVEAAAKIAKGTLGTTTGVSKNADNELSLIDFGGDLETNGSSSEAAAAPVGQPGGLEDDLLGLSMGESSFGQGGGISLGFGNNTSKFVKLFARVSTHVQRSPRSSINLLHSRPQYSERTNSDSVSSTSSTTRQTRLLFVLCLRLLKCQLQTSNSTAITFPTTASSSTTAIFAISSPSIKTSATSRSFRGTCVATPGNATTSYTIHVRLRKSTSCPTSTSCRR